MMLWIMAWVVLWFSFLISSYTSLICVWRWMVWLVGGHLWILFLIDYSFVWILERTWICLCKLHMDFIDTFIMHIFRGSFIRSSLRWLFLNNSMSFVIIKRGRLLTQRVITLILMMIISCSYYYTNNLFKCSKLHV